MMIVWMMGIVIVCIGLFFLFNQIGWWVLVLLVFLCVVQGFVVGGEWGGVVLFLVENVLQGKKVFYSSGVQVGYGVGFLFFIGLVLLISSLISDQQFFSWGWCLLFLFSVVLVFIVLWICNGMVELQEFEVQQSQDNVLQMKKWLLVVEVLFCYLGVFLLIIVLCLCELLMMYIVIVFVFNYFM